MESKRRVNRLRRQELRQRMLLARRSLTAPDVARAGDRVAELMLEHPALRQPRLIGSYLSTGGELSTARLNALLLENGHRLALPRINIELRGIMDFYAYKEGDRLLENRFHILEPEPLSGNFISPEKIEILIVPVVAFDGQGNRLGMGGGYYDRILKKLAPGCLTVGVAYEFQRLESLAVESWDMPLDEIVTPASQPALREAAARAPRSPLSLANPGL